MRERYCRECGTVYDAMGDDDWYCKGCLLKRCRALEHEIRQLKGECRGRELRQGP